jgi:phosphatidylinositol glycan class B
LISIDASDSKENSSIESNNSFNHLKPKKVFRYNLADYFRKNSTIILLLAIILVSLIARFLSAWYAGGFVHPDEVFQSIEMVHFWIYGEYGTGNTIPWEYNEFYEYGGARSWFFVLLLVAVYRFVMLFGVDDPLILIFFARLFTALFSLVTVIVAYLFAKEVFNEKVGLICAFLCGIWWFLPFWSARTMTDSISSDLIFLSIFLIYKSFKEKANLRNSVLFSFFSGISLGFAFMLRFPSGLMGIAMFFSIIVKTVLDIFALLKVRNPKNRDLDLEKQKLVNYLQNLIPLGCLLLGSGLMVLSQGILDLITWGDFLQSPINFFIYNIIEGNSALHGTAPWYQYFIGFYLDFGSYYIFIFLAFFILGIGLGEKWKSKIFILGLMFYWITVFSFLAHKEFRFIFTFIPLGFILMASGIYELVSLIKKRPWKRIAMVAILSVITASSLAMSLYHKKWMWDWNSGICNAMYYVGQQDDAELLVVFENTWYTGGYAYLDKNITIFFIKPFSGGNFNNTFYRGLYSTNGTYCVARRTELFIVHDVLISLGMEYIAEIEGNPNAYVYVQRSEVP